MAFSSDADLIKLIPDILQLGITSFILEHPKAQAEIERELRIKWWPKKRLSFTNSQSYLEMDASKLVDAQFTEASAYLVLSRHALPKLSNWVDNDRFLSMIDFFTDAKCFLTMRCVDLSSFSALITNVLIMLKVLPERDPP